MKGALFVSLSLLVASEEDASNLLQSQASTRHGGFIAVNQSDQQKFLDTHNKYRCMHGVPLMTWDYSLASDAANWAASCCWDRLNHASERNGAGENLAWIGPPVDAEYATDFWYEEINYCGSLPGCYNNGVNFYDVGHVTQMLWRTSTKLGCAVNPQGHNYQGSGNLFPVYVCRYREHGNTGNYADNVLAKTKSEQECSGGGPAPPPGCQTVTHGECHTHVMWAMEHGIHVNAAWYPGLTEHSSFEQFQQALHVHHPEHNCPAPCSANSVSVPKPQREAGKPVQLCDVVVNEKENWCSKKVQKGKLKCNKKNHKRRCALACCVADNIM